MNIRSSADIKILGALLIILLLYLGFSVFYVEGSPALVNFNTFKYVAMNVLFVPDSLFALNKDIAHVAFAPSVPLLYPPEN
jgi:hypothetical protein